MAYPENPDGLTPLPPVVTCSVMYVVLASLPSLSHVPILLSLPGVTSPVDDLYLNPCLRVHLWGTQPETNRKNLSQSLDDEHEDSSVRLEDFSLGETLTLSMEIRIL